MVPVLREWVTATKAGFSNSCKDRHVAKDLPGREASRPRPQPATSGLASFREALSELISFGFRLPVLLNRVNPDWSV